MKRLILLIRAYSNAIFVNLFSLLYELGETYLKQIEELKQTTCIIERRKDVKKRLNLAPKTNNVLSSVVLTNK